MAGLGIRLFTDEDVDADLASELRRRVETQRQWSDRAIARTTPALLGLFSLVTLGAQQFLGDGALLTRQAAWYAKPLPTFADTLAVIRQHLWPVALSNTSSPNTDVVQIPRVLLERFTDTLAFVA